MITEAFSNYTTWWDRQERKPSNITSGLLPGEFSVGIEKNEAKLGVLGLNTAYLQLTSGNYEDKLGLDVLQFHGACDSDGPGWAGKQHACFLLTHHPPSWLNPRSQQDLMGEITDHERFAVHLCGHLHEPLYTIGSENSSSLRRVRQGRSLFGLEYYGEAEEGKRLHGYNVGQIEIGRNKGTLVFWPRTARLQGHERNIVSDQDEVLVEDHTSPSEFSLQQDMSVESTTEIEPEIPRDTEQSRVGTPNKALTFIESIRDKSRGSFASYFFEHAKTVILPPFESRSTSILHKVASITTDVNALDDLEKLILLVSVCVPFLLHQHQKRVADVITSEDLSLLSDKLCEDPHAPEGIAQWLREASPEVCAVANACGENFQSNALDDEHQIRNERVRVSLLTAILHLANVINLDEHVDPTPPTTFRSLSYPEQCCWWRQAYVRSVTIKANRLQLHFCLPWGCREEYSAILVEPLDEEIRVLLDTYEVILDQAGLQLHCARPEVIEGDVGRIPGEQWSDLRQEIQVRQAKRMQDRLHQDKVQNQRLRELLIRAEVKHAEQMAQEGHHSEAAGTYVQVAELLTRTDAMAQAAYHAELAAKSYVNAEEPVQAACQYLNAAQIWLEGAYNPTRAASILQEACKLVSNSDDPYLQVCVLLAEASVAFALIQDAQARETIQSARQLIPRIADERRRVQCLLEAVLLHASYAMVWDEWNLARTSLTGILNECQELSTDERLDVFRALMLLSIECGDWLTIDRIYGEAKDDLAGSTIPQQRGLFHMHYGASLARRGMLQQAYAVYNEATHLLEEHADAYTLGIVYQNMQFMLGRNGLIHYPDLRKNEHRRIDLFQHTQSQNKGYVYESQARSELNKQNHRATLQHIRLALACYWREGIWLGVEDSFKLLAKLQKAMGNHTAALYAAIRGNDSKQASGYAEHIRDTECMTTLTSVIEHLISVPVAACERRVAAEALRVLADVIPPARLEHVTGHLLALAQGDRNTPQEKEVHRCAFEVFRELAPQFDSDCLTKVIRTSLIQLQQPQHWQTIEEILKLLGVCFRVPHCEDLDPTLYSEVTETMLTFTGHDHLCETAYDTALYLAGGAPSCVRQKIVSFLNSSPDDFHNIQRLAFLGEFIPEERLHREIKRVLESSNRVPAHRGKTTVYTLTAFRPGMLRDFIKVLPRSLYDLVINGLLEIIINQHNDLGIRTDAVWTLSSLPREMLAGRADEILDYLLWSADGTLPYSPHVEWELRSQTDPLSVVCINSGNVEQVRRSSLAALGKLYSSVNQEQRAKIIMSFVAANRNGSPLVRQGVAIGLDTIDGEQVLPDRLILVLVALLHDPEPQPLAYACSAIGHLISTGLIRGFIEDLVDELLQLVRERSVTEVRVGLAIGLRTLAESQVLNGELREHVLTALEILADDTSFRVRYEVRSEDSPR